ncbi:hypothetical protein Droror1_Dr00025153 [Drosera rotundifolia]
MELRRGVWQRWQSGRGGDEGLVVAAVTAAEKVKNIPDMGTYVQLLEYYNIEGMILLSELSRRRIRKINGLIKNFKLIVADPDAILESLIYEFKELGPDGQEEAMRKAEAAGSNDGPVKIKLVAPPLYVLTTQTLEKEQGIAILNKAIKACTEEIEKYKGKVTLKEEPRAVSERDDKMLVDTMNKLNDDNKEISGDEDSEEEEDTGMGDADLENATGITE